MKTKYAIIENEYFALESLKRIISQLRPDYELAFMSESVEETTAFLKKDQDIQIIFMDVELVDGNCFEIFSQVHTDIPIIFTTAYIDFAIQAFGVNSVDYLLKPISELSVEKALNKYEKTESIKRSGSDPSVKAGHPVTRSNVRKRILTTQGDNYSYVDVKDVAYFISEDKYIFLVSFSGKKHFANYINLNKVEEILDSEKFIRVSRNLIVNINSIQSVSKYHNNRLILTIRNPDGKEIEVIVSAARKDDFLRFLDGDIC